MALTQKEKDRLDKLDFEKGGGFSDFITDRKKLEPADSKFLFIGLGGKGSETVASIKTEAYKQIKGNEEKRRPENFEYLIIDTDRNAMQSLVQGGFGEVGLSNSPIDNETCQLFDEIAAKKLMPEHRNRIPDYVNEWLNPMMNQELQGDGAGGIRQAGRYLLFGEDAFESVHKTLVLKLSTLQSQIKDSAKEKLIVYIFAGVSGGTGSGTIIDIPYIIRKICADKNWSVKIYGYIFLPDTYPVDATGNHLKYNSYAALKEIDTLMNLGQFDGAARFKATYKPGFTVDSSERIFDSCVLVSGKKNNGLVPKPDKFSKRVVVDNIINLVTKNETTDGFLANSFLDNSVTEIQNKVQVLPEETVPKDAYYQYTVIGTGALVLPVEQILAYVAHGTMDMLERGWDKHARQEDVEKILAKIHMLPQDQANMIIEKSKVPLMQYSKGIGGPATKGSVIDDSLFNTIKTYWLGQNVALYDAWDVAKHECLERIIKNLGEIYNSIYKDPEYGIYYLKELLAFRVVDGNGFNGIYQRITDDYLKSIDGLIAGQETLQAQINQRMREIKAELDTPLCIRANAKIEEYRELCVAMLVSKNMVDMYDDLVRDCIKQILKYLENKNEELQRYIDVFTYMKDIINRNYDSVMRDTIPLALYAGKLLDFSDRESDTTKKVLDYLDNMLDMKNPEGLTSALEDEIIRTEKKWIHSEEDFNPMLVFVRFLERQYDEIPNLTMEKFIELKYGAANFSQGMAELCQELKNKAEVIFPVSPVMSLTSLASKRYVVVPSGAINITENMEAFASANGATVSKSLNMNSMYWYNLVIGVPLFALIDIQNYEEVYENNTIAGMHLWESTSVNWKELPCLSNQTLWPTADFNRREKAYMEKVRENMKYFLECGLVKRDNDTGVYFAYCMPEDDQDITDESILKWCREIYLSDPIYSEDGEIEIGPAFVKRMAEELKFVEFNLSIPTVYMKTNHDNIYKILRMNVFLYQRLLKTYGVYKKCEKMISGIDNERKNLQRYYEYVRTGIIQMTENAVFLEKRDGEQEEIIYLDDYSMLDNQFYVYWAYKRFFTIYEDETLKELDEYKEELKTDRSEEARARYKALSGRLIKECENARELLKKLDTKKALEKAGKAGMLKNYVDFYDSLLLLK